MKRNLRGGSRAIATSKMECCVIWSALGCCSSSRSTSESYVIKTVESMIFVNII